MNRYLVIVLGSLLAGCSIYHPRPIQPEKIAAQLESRRLDDPGLKKYLEQNLGHALPDWPLEKWGLARSEAFHCDDLLTGEHYVWKGEKNYVALNPHRMPAHILKIQHP